MPGNLVGSFAHISNLIFYISKDIAKKKLGTGGFSLEIWFMSNTADIDRIQLTTSSTLDFINHSNFHLSRSGEKGITRALGKEYPRYLFSFRLHPDICWSSMFL